MKGTPTEALNATPSESESLAIFLAQSKNFAAEVSFGMQLESSANNECDAIRDVVLSVFGPAVLPAPINIGIATNAASVHFILYLPNGLAPI